MTLKHTILGVPEINYKEIYDKKMDDLRAAIQQQQQKEQAEQNEVDPNPQDETMLTFTFLIKKSGDIVPHVQARNASKSTARSFGDFLFHIGGTKLLRRLLLGYMGEKAKVDYSLNQFNEIAIKQCKKRINSKRVVVKPSKVLQMGQETETGPKEGNQE